MHMFEKIVTARTLQRARIVRVYVHKVDVTIMIMTFATSRSCICMITIDVNQDMTSITGHLKLLKLNMPIVKMHANANDHDIDRLM